MVALANHPKGVIFLYPLNLLPIDKQLHFLSGTVITLAAERFTEPETALAIGVIAGILKEVVYDMILGLGTPEIGDALATVAGALFGYSFTILF